MSRPDPKHLPHDLDAELGVLGGVLLDQTRISVVLLDTDDFYDPKHKAVFGAMRNLERDMRPIDSVTVGDALGDKRDVCEGVVGEAMLRVPTADRVDEYAAIVKRHSVSRRAILELAEVVDLARRGEISGDDVIHEATQRLSRIEVGDIDRARSMGQAVKDEFGAIYRDAMAREEGRSVYVGVPTSLPQLDKHTGGIPIGLLTILAARPGHGKTTLAQTILRACATLTPDTPILYTYEDSMQSFAQRELADASMVSTQSIRAREFNRGELEKVSRRAKEVITRRPLLVEAHGMRVQDLCRDVRRRRLRAKAEGKSVCGLVVVDYLQRMPLPESNSMRSDEKLGWVCDQLVTLAATERIAVIACSQLNRGLEKRDDKRPMLSDLRDSGKLEELCKLALGLYKPSKYEPNADPNKLEIHILKNHQGEADVAAEVFWHMPTHSITGSRDDLAGR